MKATNCLVILMAVVIAECVERYNLDTESVKKVWSAYKVRYNLDFSEETDDKRFQIFYDNVAKIEKHNSEYENGQHLYHLGLTQFTYLTDGELKQHSCYMPNIVSESPTFSSDIAAPDSFDWRAKGAVTPVKDQKQCGACWAFSVVATLEGAHKIKTGELVSLSEQQLVDCAKSSSGCHGGQMRTSFDYIRQQGGVDTESSYPYEAKAGECRFSKSSVGATCSGYQAVPPDENALKQALTVNPLVICINTPSSFGHYKGGIYHDPKCYGPTGHAVAIVGYGTENGVDFWIVKNSWGSSWGEHGYIRMIRHVNICNITSSVSYPIV